MIFIFQNGRFGNQLFQINYIFNIKKNSEKVFFIGFEETYEFFLKNKDLYFIKNRFLVNRRFKILSFLKHIKLFNLIIENKIGSKIHIHSGLLKNFKFVDGFFQSEKYVNKFFLKTLINSEKFKIEDKKAKKKINQKNKKTNLYIHIRLTDYRSWPSKQYSAAMSFDWYKNLYLQYFNKKKCLIFTDDFKKLIKINFFKIKKFRFIKENYLRSFFLMKNCKYGIISSSSFSWWASYLSSKDNKKSKFIAPNYWVGNKMKKFYPNKIKSKFLIYK